MPNPKEIRELSKSLRSTYVIECNECYNSDEWQDVSAEFDAAQIAYKDGWRLIDGKSVCPECFEEIQEDKKAEQEDSQYDED